MRHTFSDGNAKHPGALDNLGKRNVPGLANARWMRNLTWANDELEGLEAQALIPILGDKPVEMGMKGKEAELARRLARNACYLRLFAVAFPERGGGIDRTTITAALASFERTMVSNQSPYDNAERQDRPLSSPAAEKGCAIFNGNGTCASCHSGPLFSDNEFHRILPQQLSGDDLGLTDVTGHGADRGLFRTPSLRNAALTAPYWHDGEAKTLGKAILRHQSLEQSASALTDREIAGLVSFIETLTDDTFVAGRRFSYPDEACPLPN